MMKNLIMIGVASSLLAACSSNKVAVMDTAPPYSGVDKKVYDYKTKLANEQVDKMPEWYTKIPVDEESIYAVGTAVSPDLQLTVDIAVLNAKTTLADRINGRVRSQTKTFIAKIGAEETDTSVLSEVEKATKNIIADVDVAGYKVSESSVVANGTQYRAYVLLEYSDKEANKIIMNRLRKDRMLLSKIRSTKAWKELDESVNEQHDMDSQESLTNMEILTQ